MKCSDGYEVVFYQAQSLLDNDKKPSHRNNQSACAFSVMQDSKLV